MKDKVKKGRPTNKENIVIFSSIKLMGKFYMAQGKTIEEAIRNLTPKVSKGYGLLILERGDIKRTKILSSKIVMGLFGKTSRLAKEIAWKQVLKLFNKDIFEK